MILVVVGMHFQSFDRLIEKMDELTPSLGHKVVMQIGSSTYEPRNAEYFRFTDGWRMEHLTGQADVVVSHAAAGAIITALKWRTPLIVVPRLKRFGEHVDDHQLQLAEALSGEGSVTAVYDVEHLERALKSARQASAVHRSSRAELVAFLRGYVDKLEARSARTHRRAG